MNPAVKPVLSKEELKEVMRNHPAWKLQDGKMVRELTFSDFAAAIDFVNRIAALAESANHHPDIDIRYNLVLLALVSHDAGGITGRDAALAARIDKEA